MKKKIHFLMAILSFLMVLAGCRSTKPPLSEPLSFAQWEKADLLLMPFHSFEAFSISKPNLPSLDEGTGITKEQFDKLINSIELKKDFAVVVFSKTRQSISKQSLDEIEKWLLDTGFRRVVIQQQQGIVFFDDPIGIPIIRDSDKLD